MQIEIIGENIPKQEVDAYADRARKLYSDRIIRKMTIQADGDFVDLKYEFDNIPFERVRRITGYLVGSLDSAHHFQNASVMQFPRLETNGTVKQVHDPTCAEGRYNGANTNSAAE